LYEPEHDFGTVETLTQIMLFVHNGYENQSNDLHQYLLKHASHDYYGFNIQAKIVIEKWQHLCNNISQTVFEVLLHWFNAFKKPSSYAALVISFTISSYKCLRCTTEHML